MERAGTPRAFFLFRDSQLRREALTLAPGAGQRYSLYGLDEVAAAGLDVAHNLEDGLRPGRAARAAASTVDRALRAAGGYSGDFATVIACRKRINAADVVFSTVDTVGIPLALLGRAGAVRPPIVYAAIGLPERLEQLRTGAARHLFETAYARLHTIVAYGWGEADALSAWLGEEGPRVVFVPFGVDAAYFRPRTDVVVDTDVAAVGADPRRDFELLVDLARRRPTWSFRIVASRDHERALAGAPANVRIEIDAPFELVRDRLAAARIVALPVRDNTYSGATTVLLQAMACGKPVVVTRTAAINRGYHLEDGMNCRLVGPRDLDALEHAAASLLDDPENAAAVGARARETVERHLTWRRYASDIHDLLLAACSRTTVSA